ncbi:MAG: maleylpyruvate isomerase family mycothiol-dependent enzyme [Chloroflexota bacterium]|nr:maleylpyruvate isomerase family mycothiol-dependent enzyme [Chloroflexota bacterium]
MPTPTEMQTRTRLARFEAERLASYLGGLSPEGWNHPTACDLWQVGDLVGHMVWIGEFYVKFVTRSLAGDITPPPGSPRDPRFGDLPPEAFYDLTAREYRQNLGNDLLPAFVSHFQELNALLDSLTPDDYDKVCFYHSSNRPLWTLADLTIQELAVHAWDIQSHTEPGTPLSPESQPALLDRVVQRLQPALPIEATASGPATLRFQLSGASDRAYDIILSADSTTIQPSGNSSARAAVSCDTETFILMLYRRLNLAHILDGGRGSLTGDEALAQDFARTF